MVELGRELLVEEFLLQGLVERGMSYLRLARRGIETVFLFQAEDGIRDGHVTGVQTCALPIFVPMMPGPWLSRWPPKNSPNCASMEIAPAIVAVIVMVSVSRLRTWASSWASTPAISSRESIRNSPVVAATAACSG